MSRYHYEDLANFLLHGTRVRHGEMLAAGNQVTSYDVIIAIVDRENKTVKVNTTKYSKTTTHHQNTVMGAARDAGFTQTKMEQP